MSDTVILVGLRADGAERDRNWAFNRARWEQLGWPIFEEHDDGPGPFSLAPLANQAAQRAGGWQVALFVGADFFAADLEQAREAVALAERKGKLVFAHDYLTLLSPEESEAVHAGQPVVSAEERRPNTFSGVLAFRRDVFEMVGGFDERFVGWGGEDIAFWCACNALAGYSRIRGDIYHLYHPRPNERHEFYPGNDELMRRYLAAKNNPSLMRSLINERL